MTVELEAFDAKETGPLFYGEGGGSAYTISLTVGTTLPPDDDLFAVAKLSAVITGTIPVGDESPEAYVETAQLIVLAVDSLGAQEV